MWKTREQVHRMPDSLSRLRVRLKDKVGSIPHKAFFRAALNEEQEQGPNSSGSHKIPWNQPKGGRKDLPGWAYTHLKEALLQHLVLPLQPLQVLLSNFQTCFGALGRK